MSLNSALLSRRNKNAHISAICEEIETQAERNETRFIFQKIRLIAREFKMKKQVIQDEHGVVRTNVDDVAKAWRKYWARLYSSDEDPNVDFSLPPSGSHELESEPDILFSEVEHAIEYLKKNRVCGPD